MEPKHKRDRTLRVLYHRGIDSDLFVGLYRGKFHIGTIEVSSSNHVIVFLGLENSAGVEIRPLPSYVRRN